MTQYLFKNKKHNLLNTNEKAFKISQFSILGQNDTGRGV